MRRRVWWIICLAALLALIVAACAPDRTIEKPVHPETVKIEKQPSTITLNIDGSTYIPDVTRSLHFDYMKGIILRQALESSGIVQFSEDRKSILSVGDVSLDSTLEWGVRLNDKDLPPSAWDNPLQAGDVIFVYVKTVGSYAAIPKQASLLLRINGGSSKPGLRRYYVNKYEDNTTVRDLLKRSGIVKFNVNNTLIVSVNGYVPEQSEKWTLKVNRKQLIDGGLDMRLKPQDSVELMLINI